MSGYRQGRDTEWAARDALADFGCRVIRASSSKGAADLAAFHPSGAVLAVTAKRSPAALRPHDRAEVLACAVNPHVLPLAVTGPPSRLEWRLVTGPGPADWTPWHPEELR